MDSLLRLGASNALAACALALLAAAVGRFCRRPAVVHGLWLLVLLKLVTPPVLPVRLLPDCRAVPAASLRPSVVQGAEDAVPPPAPDEPPRGDDGPAPVPEEAAVPVPVAPAPEAPEATEPPPPAPADAGGAPFPWAGAVFLLWAAGSAAWLVLAWLRTYRFGRLLRFAAPAPAALQDRAADLAARLGLARCPGIWLLPGQLSPMLWALGGAPRVFLPAGLLGRLGPAQQDAVLAHELAHLRRRDHWIRGLELLVTVLYWWHPVVWWARRELREAEEQCCDAWVLWALPGAQKTYALALVETVDFLSEAWSALPQGASGIGQVPHLRRRITMIMRGTTPRALTWAGGLAVVALGAVLLPLLPTWERTQAADPVAREEPRPGVTYTQLGQSGTSVNGGESDILQGLRYQAETRRQQLAQAKASYDEAQRWAQAAEAAYKDAQRKATTAEGAPAKARKAIIIIEGEDGKERRIEVLGDKLMIVGSASLRQVYTPPAGVRFTVPTVTYRATTAAPLEKRVADLEQELKQVRKELDALRQERQQHRASPYTPLQGATPAPGGLVAPAAPAASPTAPVPPAAAEPSPAPATPPPAPAARP